MQIQQSSQDGMTVLTLVGPLDLAAAPQLQRAVLKHLAQHPPAMARLLRIHPSLEEALANARTRPSRLRERLLLGPVPTAARAGRGFVRQVCGRGGLGG